MEKETELYLIKRIRELEEERNQALSISLSKKEDIKREFIAEYRGYDVDLLLRKAEAYDYLQDLLGLAVCNWVEQKTYELYSNKTSKDLHIKLPISQEHFVKLWGLLNGD